MSDKFKFILLCLCGAAAASVSTIEILRDADTTPLSGSAALVAMVLIGLAARYALRMNKKSKPIHQEPLP